MNASAIEIDGRWSDVYKDPVTDQGKRSKRGRLALVRDGGWRTVRRASVAKDNAFRTVYRDGRLLVDESFDTIRARVHGA
jgi:nicotinamide phosphoribosyltransferase